MFVPRQVTLNIAFLSAGTGGGHTLSWEQATHKELDFCETSLHP
jgi:hypothetical protein